MGEAINELVSHPLTFFKPTGCDSMASLIDSMPIITCAGKNDRITVQLLIRIIYKI